MEKDRTTRRLDRHDTTVMQWEIHQEIDRRVVELAPIADLVIAIERLRRMKRAQKEIELLGSVFKRALAREIIKRDLLY